LELEDAEKYFQSEKFQVGYHAYVEESKQHRARIEHELSERKRKRAEYEASPQYILDQELKKQRQVIEDMQDAVKKDVMQALHDALVRGGASCADYDDDDYRCC